MKYVTLYRLGGRSLTGGSGMEEYTVVEVTIATVSWLVSATMALILMGLGKLTLCSTFVVMLSINACLVLVSLTKRLYKKTDEVLPACYIAIALALVSYVSSSETITSIIGLNYAELLAAITVMGAIFNLSVLVCKIYEMT